MKQLIITSILLLSSTFVFAYPPESYLDNDVFEKMEQHRRDRMLKENNESLRHIEQMLQKQEIDNLL